MQLTEHVKPAPKVETVKTYSDEEEANLLTWLTMVLSLSKSQKAWAEALTQSEVKHYHYLEQDKSMLYLSKKSLKGQAKLTHLADCRYF